MTHISRVSYGKPHTSGHGWFITLDCGHRAHWSYAPNVGAETRCDACERIEAREQEGCGGDAILDRNVA